MKNTYKTPIVRQITIEASWAILDTSRVTVVPPGTDVGGFDTRKQSSIWDYWESDE